MTLRTVTTTTTSDPTKTALVAMGRAAEAAANTWTMREWAARLASRAGPRDYLGQLRELYLGILERWRYVQEPGEWVSGSARAVLGNVLGLSYQGADDPERASVESLPVRRETRGWGDCDDVATLTAAGVRALGMTPQFRVTQGPSGGHVHVLVRTPVGQVVSLDPVGHPEHPFGWMLPAQNAQVYDLDARPVGLGCLPCLAGPGRAVDHGRTQVVRVGASPRGLHVPRFYCEAHPGLKLPSVMAIHAGQISADAADHGLRGVDEHGQSWELDAENRVFVPLGSFADMRRRWKKRFKFVARAAEKIGDLQRAIAAKILKNKAVANVVSGILQVYGIPFPAAKGIIAAGAELIKHTGIFKFVREMKKDKKFVLKMLAKALKKGLVGTGIIPPALQKKMGLSGVDDRIAVIRRGGDIVALQPLGLIVELSAAPEWVSGSAMPDIDAEGRNARQAASMRPKNYKSESQRAGQSTSDWLSNVGYWATYPKAPRKIARGDKAGAAAWVRISKVVSAELKGGKSTGPAITPTKRPAKSKTAFAVNPNESAIAAAVASERPRSHVHQGSTYTQGASKPLKTWLTDVSYYRAYPAGPAKIGKSDRGYAAAWMRLNADVSRAMKTTPTTQPNTTTTTIPTTQPNTTTTTIPTTQPNTTPTRPFAENASENAIASAVVSERPSTQMHRGQAFAKGAKKPLKTWLTDVSYYRAYPDGPSKIGTGDRNYAAAWLRLNRTVSRLLATKPGTTTPSNTQRDNCIAAGGAWDTTSRICRSGGVVVPQIDTRAQDCAIGGGTWDAAAQRCRKTEIVPNTDPSGDDDDPTDDPNKLPDVIPKKSNLMIPLAIAGAAALLIMSRKK